MAPLVPPTTRCAIGESVVLITLCSSHCFPALTNLTAALYNLPYLISQENEFDWDEQTQGYILSAFFWGYVLTHIPGGLLAERFGGKQTLGLGILSTSVLTLLTPLAARAGPWWLITVRFVEGLGEVSVLIS